MNYLYAPSEPLPQGRSVTDASVQEMYPLKGIDEGSVWMFAEIGD